MQENEDQNNSEYGHFSHSGLVKYFSEVTLFTEREFFDKKQIMKSEVNSPQI